MRQLLCCVAAGLVLQIGCMAAGTLVETRNASAPPQKITLAWTADTNGNVSVTNNAVRGEATRAVFASGVPAPTGTTFVATLSDASGIDLLAGQGVAVSMNVTQILIGTKITVTAGVTNWVPNLVVSGPLSLAISGVGSNATGTVILYCK